MCQFVLRGLLGGFARGRECRSVDCKYDLSQNPVMMPDPQADLGFASGNFVALAFSSSR
jgi:hypothetical protein